MDAVWAGPGKMIERLLGLFWDLRGKRRREQMEREWRMRGKISHNERVRRDAMKQIEETQAFVRAHQ